MLTPNEEDECRNWSIERFGLERVKRLDLLFFEFHDIRAGCKDNFEFLSKVMEKFPETGEHLTAALLYGMKIGEITAKYYLKQQELQRLPAWGHAE